MRASADDLNSVELVLEGLVDVCAEGDEEWALVEEALELVAVLVVADLVVAENGEPVGREEGVEGLVEREEHGLGVAGVSGAYMMSEPRMRSNWAR